MGVSGGEATRRRVFTPHAHDLSKMRRCPICRWAVEQDHAEALGMQPHGVPTKSPPARPLPVEADVQDAAEIAGFALV
jgi:hypothetical protein